MQDKFTYLEKIERYLNGQMGVEELQKFEQELANNEDLSKELILFQELMIGVDVFENRKIEKTVNQVHNKLKAEKFFAPQQTKQIKMTNSKKFNRRYLFGIAASLALMVAAAIYLLRPKTTVLSPKEAFAQFNHPDTIQIKSILDRLEATGLALESDRKADSLAIALGFYEDFNYEEARKSLDVYLQRYPNDKIAQLYFGLSLFQLEDYGRGVEILQPLALDESFEKRDLATWYTALGLTQFEGNTGTNSAKKLLESLCKMNSEYQELACNFLKHFL